MRVPSAPPWRGVLLRVALLVPALAVSAGSSAAADRLGTDIALRLRPLFSPIPSAGQVAASAADSQAIVVTETRSALTASRAIRAKRVLGPTHPRSSELQRGLRISSAQVLALAARRAMPQAVPVQASAEHPAGLLLREVSALGVGLRDGDVLTEAAGQKASSVAVVVGIVLSARSRQVPEIGGRFFRGAVPFALTVEQPYPKQVVPD